MIAPANLKITPPLSEEEQAQLVELELILARAGRDEDLASLDRAKALFRVSEGRLFRGHANCMKNYGLKWGIKPTNTCRLTKAGKVFFNLQSLWEMDGLPAPTSAWQLLPLARLKTVEEQGSAWHEAVILANGTVPSEARVEASVAALSPEKVQKKKRPIGSMRLDLREIPGLAEVILEEARQREMAPEKLVLAILGEARASQIETFLEGERAAQSGAMLMLSSVMRAS